MESQNKGGNFYQVQNRPYCNHCTLHCPSLLFPTPYGVATPYNPQQLNPYQQHRINNIRSALRNAQIAQTQEPAVTQLHPTPVRQAHPYNPSNRFNTFPQHTRPNPWAPGFNHHNRTSPRTKRTTETPETGDKTTTDLTCIRQR